MSKLTKDFYTQTDTISIAKELIGKVLITNFNEKRTSGIITETEAYCGTTDKACHAYGNRRTKRTETMYAQGGISYVYLCYGIHHLFNIVTNTIDEPHAILIRAIAPLEGIDIMKIRRNKTKVDKTFSAGPGTMSQALGITTFHNNIDLTGNQIWIEDIGYSFSKIEVTKRIGIDYAQEDALLPYRFVVIDNI